MAEGNSRSDNAFCGLTFSSLQEFGPEQLLLISCMTGLEYLLTKGLYPCNCWGQTSEDMVFQALTD